MLTGEELRCMREAAGLMRRELAGMLGLDVTVVKLAEAGMVGLVGARELLMTILREELHGNSDATKSA
jgi:DNA-binding transcriptional regulator YiaG